MIHQWTCLDLGFLVIWKLFPNIFSIKSTFFSRPFSKKTKRVLKIRIILPYYALSQLSNEGLLVSRGQKLWQLWVGPSHLQRINERTLVIYKTHMHNIIYKYNKCIASRYLYSHFVNSSKVTVDKHTKKNSCRYYGK